MLVQITDIHCGPIFHKETPRSAVKEINDLSPDFLLRGFFPNSYNAIDVRKKKIDAKLKVVNGEFVDLDEIVKRREVLEESDISEFSDSLAR